MVCAGPTIESGMSACDNSEDTRMAGPTHGAAPRFLEKPVLDLLCVRLRLSRRESQIVRRLFGDLTEAAIAHELDMSPHTLRTHVERLYRKLGVTCRMELTVCLYESFMALTGEPDSPLPPLCPRYAAGACPLQG